MNPLSCILLAALITISTTAPAHAGHATRSLRVQLSQHHGLDKASYARSEADCLSLTTQVRENLQRIAKADPTIDPFKITVAASVVEWQRQVGRPYPYSEFPNFIYGSKCVAHLTVNAPGLVFTRTKSETLHQKDCSPVLDRNSASRPGLLYQAADSGWLLFYGSWCNVVSIELLHGTPTDRLATERL